MSDPIQYYTTSYILLTGSSLTNSNSIQLSLNSLYANSNIPSLGNVSIQTVLNDSITYPGAAVTIAAFTVTGSLTSNILFSSVQNNAILTTTLTTSTGAQYVQAQNLQSINNVLSVNYTFTQFLQEITLSSLSMTLASISNSENTTVTLSNLQIIVEVAIEINRCSGSNANNSTCLQYCTTSQQTLEECQPTYYDYCFTPSIAGNATTMPIGSSSACQSYWSAYNSSLGPQGSTPPLEGYCQAKYPNGIAQLLLSGSASDKTLCSCHMQPSQYQNVQNSLNAAFTGLPSVDPSCYVGQCSSNTFGSTRTNNACPSTPCINVQSYNLDGSFLANNATIQSGGSCSSVQYKGSSPAPTPSPTPTPAPTPAPRSYRNYYIAGGVVGALVVVTIIVALVGDIRREKVPQD